MGIWGNIGDRLTGALCKNLITDLLKGLSLDNLTGPDLVGGLLKPMGTNGGQVPLVGGLLGSKQEQRGTPAPQKMPAQNGQLLGNLLGGGQRKPTMKPTTNRNRFPFDF